MQCSLKSEANANTNTNNVKFAVAWQLQVSSQPKIRLYEVQGSRAEAVFATGFQFQILTISFTCETLFPAQPT